MKARFYLAQAAEQDGDRDKARSHYAEIVAALAGRSAVAAGGARAPREASRGTSAAAVAAALPAQDREAAIRGMVEGLAARLEARAARAEEWSRLVRSYAVLGERDKAAPALDKARGSRSRAKPVSSARPLDVTVARELKLDAVESRR